MTLHLIKLCVGADSIADLAAWQKTRAARRRGAAPVHVTRQTPRRAGELLAGGSLYWVIGGQVAVRQRLVALRPAVKNGAAACALVLDAELVPVVRRVQRPFQGWRYLEPEDAPRDLKAGMRALPESLHAELAELGLL